MQYGSGLAALRSAWQFLASRARQIAIAGLFLVVALVQTAPLLTQFTSHIPHGTYPASTTARYALWTLWWNSERMADAYADYWQAPIFHPDEQALVYSEPQFLTGMAFGPILWITENPALTYNLVLLAIFMLNGGCAFYLLRQLHLPFWPALAGGVAFEMLPIIADQLGVIHTIVFFPCPMVLAQLLRFHREGGRGPLIRCALWMAAMFHTSAHTALLFGPLVLLGFIVLAPGRLSPRQHLAAAIIAVLLTGALVAPVAMVQMQVLGRLDMRRSRSPKVIANTSARIEDYTKMSATNFLRQRELDRRGYALGPGLVILPFALLGAWYGLRRERYRRWTIYCMAAAAGGLLLSFGPNAPEPLVKVYQVLQAFYPGFELARNLWRFGGLAQIFLVILAAMGATQLYRRSWMPRAPFLLAAVLLLGADWLAAPVKLLPIGADPPKLAWIDWLRQAPPDIRYAHVPMVAGGRADEFEKATQYMTYQMYHGRTMANGFASYRPIRTKALTAVMMRFPDAESISGLRRLKITHLLVEVDWYQQQEMAFEVWSEHLELEADTPEVKIFRIKSSSG